jgi:hypothetical protein
MALANFLRLSLRKAAHAGVGGAPCRKSGYVGRKRWAQPNDRFVINGRHHPPLCPISANLSGRQEKSEKTLFCISNSPQDRHPQDDDLVGVLTRNIQNKLALMPLCPRLWRGSQQGTSLSPSPSIHPQQQTWRKGNSSAMFASRGQSDPINHRGSQGMALPVCLGHRRQLPA